MSGDIFRVVVAASVGVVLAVLVLLIARYMLWL
jgi:hypothetical protein